MAAPLPLRAALVIAAATALVSSPALAQPTSPAAPDAVADPTTSVSPEPPPEPPPAESAPATKLPPPSPIVPAKYLVVGSLGLGAGVAFFVSALFDSFATSAHTDATTLAQQRACGAGPSCSAFDAKHDDASRDRAVSGVFLGVGSVVAVGAIAAWVFWPDDDKSAKNDRSGTESDHNQRDNKTRAVSSPWFAPSVGPHGASLAAGVRF